MSQFYRSQICLMERKASDQGIDEDAFNTRFLANLKNAFLYRHHPPANGAAVTFNVLYYLAEKDTWEQMWPSTPFPGADPRATYKACFVALFARARDAGVEEKEMQRVWMRCLDGATKKYAERGGMEVVQYEAEQAFWEVYWGGEGGVFGGVNPGIRGGEEREERSLA